MPSVCNRTKTIFVRRVAGVFENIHIITGTIHFILVALNPVKTILHFRRRYIVSGRMKSGNQGWSPTGKISQSKWSYQSWVLIVCFSLIFPWIPIIIPMSILMLLVSKKLDKFCYCDCSSYWCCFTFSKKKEKK